MASLAKEQILIRQAVDQVLHDPDASIRFRGCNTLRMIGDKRAIPALESEAANDEGLVEGQALKDIAIVAINEIHKRWSIR